jgi:hypothetical protein
MWERWSRLLEGLGRLRLRFPGGKGVPIGDPSAPDAQGGDRWREFLRPEELFRVWGPLEGSPWEPYHSVPLFAALERAAPGQVGPSPVWERESRRRPATLRPGAPVPGWVDRSTLTIVDLPGPRAVEAAAWLVTGAGVQPVCTFDHWPHPKGLLRADQVLAELLFWASTLDGARGRIQAGAPAVWICDSERLGTRAGKPGEFDNRYFLDDSVLPGAGFLVRAGIRRVVYLIAADGETPLVDLEAWFADLLSAGIAVLLVTELDPTAEPKPFSAPPSPRPPPRSGFLRSAAGGFGTSVPVPSSGGGG